MSISSAKQKARQLLSEAGNNLSAKEAQRIERKTDIPIQQVLRIAERQEVNVPQRVENRVQAIVEQRNQPAPPPPNSNPPPQNNPPPSSVSNVLTRYKGPGGGFGYQSYQAATAAGYTPAEILRLLPGSGLNVGERAQAQLDEDWRSITSKAESAGTYANLADQYRQSSEDYKSKLSDYSSTFDNLTSKYNDALAKQQSSAAQADAEKKRADELEQQRKDEQEIEASQQLTSLRGGYTASGGSGSGLGSLSSGSTRSISTGGRSGGILDRAYQDIDPTDSVLNKSVAVEGAWDSSGGLQLRSLARQRALASGTSASQYYARRFG